MGLKHFVLIGHSMGGKIALALAARIPEGMQAIILVAPSPPTPEPMSDTARKELWEMYGDSEKIAAHLQKICAQPLSEPLLAKETELNLRTSAVSWKWWLEGGSREDISRRLEDIVLPVLVLYGAADKGITKELLMKEVVGRLSNARLDVIADSGHLIPLEQAGILAAAIRTWLKQDVPL